MLLGSPDLFTGVNRGWGQTRKLKPMGTHKPSYHGLLLPQDRALLGHPPRPEDREDSSAIPTPHHSQSPGALRRRAAQSGLGSLALPRELGPNGQAGTITRRHFISRRRWAVFWRQATVSGSDKKHLNPIMD